MLGVLARNRLVALCLLVVLLDGALALEFPNQPDGTAAYRRASQEIDQDDSKWRVSPTLLEAMFTGFIAFIALWQIRETRMTSKRQLRAYVSALPTNAAILRDDNTMVLRVILRNRGMTPAFEFRSFGDIRVIPLPIRGHRTMHKDAQDAGKAVPTYVFYPGAKHASESRHEFTWQELIQINSGHFAVCAYGRLEYVDAFGDDQWAEYFSILERKEFLDWARRAINEPDRQAVLAGFKFTEGNNRASFL